MAKGQLTAQGSICPKYSYEPDSNLKRNTRIIVYRR